MATVDELFNSGRTLSQDEVDALVKFCAEHNLAVDGKPGENNGKEIAVYIVDTWGQRITPATLAVAVEKLKDRLTFLTSQAESQYNKVAAENPAAAQQVMDWLGNQKSLVNTGDEGFQNAFSILQELRGRAVTPETIQNAIALIGAPVSRFHAARRPLHFVQTSRRTEPVSVAAKNDDGERFLGSGLTKQRDGSWGKSPADYAREAREAADKANTQPKATTTTPLSAADERWKSMALDVRTYHGPGHIRVRHVYDELVAQGTSWRQVYETCKQLRNQAMQEQAS